MRYSQLHGDVVAVVFAKGLLLVRRDLWLARPDEVGVAVGTGDRVQSVRVRLIAAHAELAVKPHNGTAARG